MIDAIIYNSNTGFSKQYAYSFAVTTKLPIYSLKEIKKVKPGSHIIFFSWILGGNIVKLKKVKNYVVDMVCAVGMSSYSEEMIEKLKQINGLEQVFYLQGGMRLPKLSIPYRMMIKMVSSSLKKKEKQGTITPEDKETLYCMQNGRENIDLDALNPLVDWYMNINDGYVS